MFRQPALTKEKAIGDGNCAFNAFILGLAEKTVLDGIEANLRAQKKNPLVELHYFITKVNAVLLKAKKPTWQDIKLALIDAKKEAKRTLQIKLQKILRELVNHQIENMAAIRSQHFESTLEPLMAELRNYFHQRNLHQKIENVSDVGDIFIRHEFMKDYFEQLFLDYDLITAQNNLSFWWMEEGYNQFLNEMKKPGVWAGDLELVILAKFFGVNLDIISVRFNNRVIKSHVNNGVFLADDISKETINQLIARGIIDGTPSESGKYRWAKCLSEKELRLTLTEVPEWKTADASYPNIADDLSDTAITAMMNRGILKINKEKKLAFFFPKKESELRAMELKESGQIIAAWKNTHLTSPTITLRNDRGIHWDNMHRVAKKQKIVEKESFVAALDDDYGFFAKPRRSSRKKYKTGSFQPRCHGRRMPC